MSLIKSAGVRSFLASYPGLSLRCGSSLLPALHTKAHGVLLDAASRARDNGRSTLLGRDVGTSSCERNVINAAVVKLALQSVHMRCGADVSPALAYAVCAMVADAVARAQLAGRATISGDDL